MQFNFHQFLEKHPEHPYHPGRVEVTIKAQDGSENGVYVHINTPRLNLGSIASEDQEFFRQLRGDPNVMASVGSATTWAPADEYSGRQIQRWKDGIHFAGFIITLREGEGNNLKTNTITRSVPDEGRIGYTVMGFGGSYICNTAEIVTILSQDSWGHGYAKEALWAISNPYAFRLKEKGLFKDRCGEDLVGIESTARTDNVCSIDAVLNSGADIQCIPDTRPTPYKQLFNINSPSQIKPIQAHGKSRFAFFKDAQYFIEDESKFSIQALLPNTVVLAAANAKI